MQRLPFAILALGAMSLALPTTSSRGVAESSSAQPVLDRIANTTACSACHASALAQDDGKTPAIVTDPLAVLFETKIRPILINRCEECHADKADGDLRVDSREALMKGGESGVVIVPGDPDGSVLIQAVRRTHAKLSMPKRRAKLPDDEIDALVEWVQKGAYWPDAAPTKTPSPLAPGKHVGPEQRAFWSLQPIAKPAVPEVVNRSWPVSDIDRFVLARLEHDGLAPVASADRRTLIRRATLDLTGLPPTPEEVEAFVDDAAPDAYTKVVDRLLASPRYGETWGRWWLDVARYAEDDCRSLDPMGRGYNPYPNAYRYRDWVIKAFNDDLPYDSFVKAQLAADLLETPPRASMLPALGFLGLGPWYYDNGSVEVTRADERHDRVDVVSRGLLGMTVACARCHDHKYDPIATEDYYALAGVFQNTIYHEYPEVPQSVVDDYKTQEKRIENKEKLLREFEKTESRQLAETLAFQTANYMRAAWKVADDPKHNAARIADDEKLDYELFERWIAFLAKPPKHYPNLVPWQEMIARKGKKDEASKLADEFQTQLIDVMFEHKELEEENDIIRAKALPGTTKKKRAKLPNEFVTNDDFCPGCGLELKSLSLEKQNLWTDVFDRDLDTELNIAQGGFDDGKPGVLAFEGYWLERQLSADRLRYVQALTTEIKALRKALPAKYPYVHGVVDAAEPTPIRVHVRGSPFKLGAEVPRHFPALLCPDEPQPFTSGSGRRELAEAIMAQPITLRVIVNRVWKGHFGTGIVDTPGDFGHNGERPTNPQLLEYLAALFVDQGMSLKKLHRAIMLSAVYQLSSSDSPADSAVDSGNRLYWRANERRMTAEQIRDSALFASGALDEKMAGPSEKLTPLGKRRTVYGQISRYRLDGFLALFDFPAANASSERRFTTHVPLQRLFFMNSDFMQQQGELLARRVAAETNDSARIQKMYALLFGRAASDEEVRAGLAYLQSEPMKQYEERKAARLAKEAADKDKPEAAAMPSKYEEKGEEDDDGDDGKDKESADMMAGVNSGGAGEKPDNKLLPVTVWGRYAKVLMSSSEFLHALKHRAMSMNFQDRFRSPLTRRDALRRIGGGFGMLAFASLFNETFARARTLDDGSGPRPFDHPPKAKAVIFLMMNGGLSQVDSFDPKPMLDKYNGQPLPGGSIATERKTGTLLRSPFTFKKYGQCGMEISELFPHVGECADDICFVRSMYTDIPNHEPSLLMMNTGHTQNGRPSIGSWLTYGLGSGNKNLPGFVVLCPDMPTTAGPPLWNNAFLPAVHQGTFISDRVERQTADELIGKEFDPKKLVRYLSNDKFTLTEQRRELDLALELDRMRRERDTLRDPQLEAAIESMELAYRMQTEALEVFDIRRESKATLELYGRGSTARGCLMAVRLIERGVRMVQVYYASHDPWDHHSDIQMHRDTARDSDQPFAAVIKDLKSRGLFDSTLVVCGSEFGRTPVVEIGNGAGGVANGRDHNPFGFTMWLAGGGIKGGTTYGATDDFGFKAVDKPVHVHDLHATMLYLLGIDHTKLTYRFSGRDFRLTDVSGNVLHDLIA